MGGATVVVVGLESEAHVVDFNKPQMRQTSFEASYPSEDLLQAVEDSLLEAVHPPLRTEVLHAQILMASNQGVEQPGSEVEEETEVERCHLGGENLGTLL